MMKWFKRLLLAAAAFGVVLALGLASRDDGPTADANPMKINRQQYERIHQPALFADVGK
ncbi:hypothetical protein [Paenibacillus piri]|uniref:hypothetical protein n=1 Tax=Paenibacillus piri TaxID=2547395 RepID=UPI0014044428|nr:hypothetical protein [Paenibacillus piri]